MQKGVKRKSYLKIILIRSLHQSCLTGLNASLEIKLKKQNNFRNVRSIRVVMQCLIAETGQQGSAHSRLI